MIGEFMETNESLLPTFLSETEAEIERKKLLQGLEKQVVLAAKRLQRAKQAHLLEPDTPNTQELLDREREAHTFAAREYTLQRRRLSPRHHLGE